jgi:hypothetical protein
VTAQNDQVFGERMPKKDFLEKSAAVLDSLDVQRRHGLEAEKNFTKTYSK